MHNHDHDHDSSAPAHPAVSPFDDLNTPTAEEMQRVVVYVNAKVVQHLHDEHGIELEQLLNPTEEFATKLRDECGLMKMWSDALPVLLAFGQELRVKEIRGAFGAGQMGSTPSTNAAGQVKKRMPIVLGKLGEA